MLVPGVQPRGQMVTSFPKCSPGIPSAHLAPCVVATLLTACPVLCSISLLILSGTLTKYSLYFLEPFQVHVKIERKVQRVPVTRRLPRFPDYERLRYCGAVAADGGALLLAGARSSRPCASVALRRRHGVTSVALLP